MGAWRELLEEQEANGFSTSRGSDNVCRFCIDDPALADFVARYRISTCDFCGSTNKLGMAVGDLFRYMNECLRTEWDDPIHMVACEGGFVPPPSGLFDSDDLLSMVDEPLLNEDLRQEFIFAFDHMWCQDNPYRLEHSEVLIHSWLEFAEVVRTNRRFLTPLDTTAHNPMDDELLPPGKLLSAVGDAILRSGQRVLKRSADLRIIRARVHGPSEILETAQTLGSPPSSCAKHNRMSGEGISMFYGAEDTDTAVAEIRSNSNQVVTVGSWTPTRELVYLDLLATQPIPSIFDIDERYYRTELRFLVGFADDLARPIDVEDRGLEYIPTQIVTEYIRDHLQTEDGHHIDAIRYGSATEEGGVCWVVFAGPDDCGDEGDSSEPLLILDPNSMRTI